MKASQLMLQRDFVALKTKPRSEFFQVYDLVNDNIQEWEVYVIGPPDTYYEKGVYKAVMKFPDEYPIKPPTLRFACDIFHPNIYRDGKVCISTLQTGPNGRDTGQFWRPILGVDQALLSVVSLLSDPNNDDPANTAAANMYRNNLEEFRKKCRKLAKKSLELVPDDFEFPVVANEDTVRKEREGLRLELEDPAEGETSASYDDDTDSDWEPEYDPEDLSDGGYSENESDTENVALDEHPDQNANTTRKRDDHEGDSSGGSGPGGESSAGNENSSRAPEGTSSSSQDKSSSSSKTDANAPTDSAFTAEVSVYSLVGITPLQSRLDEGLQELTKWEIFCEENEIEEEHQSRRKSSIIKSLGKIVRVKSLFSLKH